MTAGTNTSVVLIDASTSGHSNDDKLVIHYEDQSTVQPISGSVSVSNLPAVQPVSGTVTANVFGSDGFAQKPIPILDDNAGFLAGSGIPIVWNDNENGPDTRIVSDYHPLPVQGDVGVSGSVSVSNLPAVQPVSGTVTANVPLINPEYVRVLPVSGILNLGGDPESNPEVIFGGYYKYAGNNTWKKICEADRGGNPEISIIKYEDHWRVFCNIEGVEDHIFEIQNFKNYPEGTFEADPGLLSEFTVGTSFIVTLEQPTTQPISGTVTASNLPLKFYDDAFAGGTAVLSQIVNNEGDILGNGGTPFPVSGTVTAVLSVDTAFNDGGDKLNVGLGAVAGTDPANWLKVNGGNVPISGTVTASVDPVGAVEFVRVLPVTVAVKTGNNPESYPEIQMGGFYKNIGNNTYQKNCEFGHQGASCLVEISKITYSYPNADEWRVSAGIPDIEGHIFNLVNFKNYPEGVFNADGDGFSDFLDGSSFTVTLEQPTTQPVSGAVLVSGGTVAVSGPISKITSDGLPYVKINGSFSGPNNAFPTGMFARKTGEREWTWDWGIRIYRDDEEEVWIAESLYMDDGGPIASAYFDTNEPYDQTCIPPQGGWDINTDGGFSGVFGISYEQPEVIQISSASLPLPAGAATSANQSTANTSLSNIDTDLGAQADASASSDTGTFSLISLFKRLLSRVTTLVPANLTVTSTRLLVDGSGVTQPVSGTVTANSPSGTVTNLSSTITTGGTSQLVAASNTSRKYFLIQNISDTDMYLGVGYTPTTTTGILLAKNGGGITFESGFIPTSAINVLCATTGKAFVALQG